MLDWSRSKGPVALLILAVVLVGASDVPREAWDVVLSEQLLFEPGAVPVILSWDKGLRARRFHLVAEAARPFDLTLVRDHDNTRIFSGRRSQRYTVLVPWGRGETAHLSAHSRDGKALRVNLRLAVDPDEKGHAVYSRAVNQFLHLYDDDRPKEARAALARALAEDPADTMAAFLWRRSWEEEGLTAAPRAVVDEEDERRWWSRIAEGQRQRALAKETRRILEEAGPDSALAHLGRSPEFETPTARREHQLLRGRLALEQERAVFALSCFYRALDSCESVEERFGVYPWLVRANLVLGNRGQAEALVEHAFEEATTDAQREQARSWLER